MFDTVLLRSFVTVVQEGGFTRAANRLHLTQSAISAHLRRLEEQAGKSLLFRTTRSVTLTSDGELLMGYARAILALNQDALTQLTRVSPRGPMRIGLSEDIVSAALMQALQRFAASRLGLTVDVRVGIPAHLLQIMDEGELDLVIGGRCHDARPGRLLWREPLVWAFAEGAALDPALPVPLALFPEPCPYREAALTALAQAGVSCRIAMVCPSSAGLRAAALAGFAVMPAVRGQLGSGLRALAGEPRLPALPKVEFTVFAAPHAAPATVDEICNAVLPTPGDPN
ncbi:LysR substrate-binding domain-containing protein [Paraburkholderia sp. 22099]|uniref:LysR substrate-binding domain-containing protein n=1 Tax=Paraburkholderia sp. 22099 TaxID=3453875 RepID=UPI003F87DEC8